MKKVILVSLYRIILLSVGFGAGFMYEILQENSLCGEIKNDENELLGRIDEYQASCRELTNKELPILHKKGKDYFIVIPGDKDEVNIVGISVENRNDPIVSVSGSGGLKQKIDQACDH
jgi:hypothetical protein